MNCPHCYNPFRGVCGCTGSLAAARAAQVCRWCRKTEAEHLPATKASNAERPRARTPCLMWRENFQPSAPTEAPPSAPAPNVRITERSWDPAHTEAWMAVDFDGTLAHYTEWKGVGVLGHPIPAMIARVKAWLIEGRRVKILTARHDNPECVAALELWCLEHLGVVLEVTGVKDRHMFELWDDRAVQIVSNTGRRADELSDEQRLQVCRELTARWYRNGRTHLDQELAAYEREAKERLGK